MYELSKEDINFVEDIRMNKFVQEIRNFINSRRKQYTLLKNRAHWNQLCSSLDTIEDCELAMNSYNNTFSEEHGESYLRLYGVLQTLFVQQDAVKHLWESLQISETFELEEELKEIRKVRNDSIGHPTKRDNKKSNTSYHSISKISMKKSDFKLMSCYQDKTEFRDISVNNLITTQNKFLSEKLKKILQSLKDEEKEHKEKFKMEKLEATFPRTLSYHVSGLFESVLDSDKKSLGNAHLSQVKTVLDNVQKKLKKRDIEINTYDSIETIYTDLEYPIKKLETFFDEQAQRNQINDKTAYIFVFFIKETMNELKRIMCELDKEYAD